MHRVAENLWTMRFPLRLLGTEQGRIVTLIRLRSGDLVIHSTGPFALGDVKAISAQGAPRWIAEAMLLHDTFTKQGMAAFPGVPLLGPEGLAEMVGMPVQPLVPAPAEWAGELQVLPLAGMPKVKEHVFLHVPSRTLIVGDLVFNYDCRGNAWERFMRRWILGLKQQPGVNRVFPKFIQDRPAFRASVQAMLAWDFDRIICGHMEIVDRDAKAKLQAALAEAGLA